MPYATRTDRTYDVGDFAGALKRCLEKADAAGFDKRAAEARRRGAIRGLGVASYIECTAWGTGETGSLAMEKDGSFTLLIGTQSNGQGHETAYAQVVAEQFEVPLARVKVVQGDTDRVPTGMGTGGSRSIPIGAVMTSRASKTLAQSLKELAAEELEAASADLEIVDGEIRIVGTDRSLSLAQIAALPSATPERLQKRRNPIRRKARPIPTGPTSARSRSTRRPARPGSTATRSSTISASPQSAAARGAGSRRRRARGGSGADGAGGVRRRRTASHRQLHGLLHAARRRFRSDRIRDPQCSLDHQSARAEGRGRGRLDRLDPGGGQRRRRRAVARLRRRPTSTCPQLRRRSFARSIDRARRAAPPADASGSRAPAFRGLASRGFRA